VKVPFSSLPFGRGHILYSGTFGSLEKTFGIPYSGRTYTDALFGQRNPIGSVDFLVGKSL
jgi:hypothetical protein